MSDGAAAGPASRAVGSGVGILTHVRAAALKPGDIVWVALHRHTIGSEQQKDRPWVVVSSVDFNQRGFGLFSAVPLSRKAHKCDGIYRISIASNVIDYKDANAPADQKLDRGIERAALCEHSRTMSEQRALRIVGTLQERPLDRIRAALALVHNVPY